MRVQEKLEKLKNTQNWHPDAMAQIVEWQKQFDDLEFEKSFLELKQVQVLAATLRNNIDNINTRLITERDIIQENRNQLFNLKELYEIMHNVFSLEAYKANVLLLEADIDNQTNT